MAWKSLRQNYRTTFSPTVPTSAAGISHVVAYVEAPGSEKWEHLKSGGKQWQANPKNLPRMQRTGAIPVTWLNSGLCPDQPKGWIPIISVQWEPNCFITYKHEANSCFLQFCRHAWSTWTPPAEGLQTYWCEKNVVLLVFHVLYMVVVRHYPYSVQVHPSTEAKPCDTPAM